MGNNSSNYKDGDIPRDTLDILFGPSEGWVYYKSSIYGKCSYCSKETCSWYITIKSNGKYICEDCKKEGKH